MARHDPNTATSFETVIEQLDHDYDETELYDEEDQYTIEEADLLDVDERLQMETDAEAEAEADAIIEEMHDENETVTGDLPDAAGNPVFECQECNAVFATAASMLEHRREEHGEDDVACVCEACDLLFGDVADLEAHIVEVHGDQVMEFGDEHEEVEVATTTTKATKATKEEAKEEAKVASKAVKAVTEKKNTMVAVNGDKVGQKEIGGK